MTIKTLSYAALAERLKCGLETARSLVTGEVATLKARIESLQAELFKLEATAARHRADYERERDRADRLVSELLKVTTNTTNEMAAKLEGEIAALRLAAEGGADIMGAMASLDRLPGPWPMTGRAPPISQNFKHRRARAAPASSSAPTIAVPSAPVPPVTTTWRSR